MMTKQLKSTGILVLILVILAGAVWWLMSTQETAVNKTTVFRIPAQEITRLTVEGTDVNQKPMRFVIEKKGAKVWEITEPIKDPAYFTMVDSLLQTLNKMEAVVVSKDSVGNLADYGLAPAVVTVQAELKGKKAPQKVLIGAQTPVEVKYFAKFGDDPRILTVNGLVKDSLNKNLNDYREKQLMVTPKEKIQTVRFWSNLDQVWYQMERQKNGFKLTQPYQDEGSANFDTILTSLTGLMINEYLDETPDLAQYGLNQPSEQVELTLDNGQRVSMKAAQKDDKWFLSSTQRPGIFQFNLASAMDFLKIGLKDLIGTQLVNFGEKEIEAITIQVGSAPEKKLNGKNFTEIRKQLLLGQVVQPYTPATKPVTQAVYDSQAPVYRLSFTTNGKNKQAAPVDLKFYINPDKKDITTYLVTITGRPFVYEVRDTENERTLIDQIKNVK